MNLKDFEEQMTLILDGCDAVNETIDMSIKLNRIDIGRRAYLNCKEYFKDEGNNIHRWLICQPNVFRHPVTERFVEIQIDEEIESLYNLLEFCRLQNCGLVYGDEFFETLALLVRVSEEGK